MAMATGTAMPMPMWMSMQMFKYASYETAANEQINPTRLLTSWTIVYATKFMIVWKIFYFFLYCYCGDFYQNQR